tara:strand:+ start:204 stop:623 length:420 start_codon:yes stop_codon:yes gene_type:complete
MQDMDDFAERIREARKMEVRKLQRDNEELRKWMERNELTHLSVTLHNDPSEGSLESPILETALHVEGIINRLLAHYGATGSDDALSLLQFIQSTLISVGLLTQEFIASFKQTAEYQDLLNGKNTDDIPQAFKDAFKSDN